MTTSLKLAHSWRDNSTYGTSIWFGYAENPLLRKFYLADRNRDIAEGHFDYAFNEKVSLGVTADYANDDYKHSQVGLTSARSANIAAELSVVFTERTQGRGFVQSQWIRSEQSGSEAFAGSRLDRAREGPVRHDRARRQARGDCEQARHRRRPHVLACAQRHLGRQRRSPHRPSRPPRPISTA